MLPASIYQCIPDEFSPRDRLVVAQREFGNGLKTKPTIITTTTKICKTSNEIKS